jgi:uncharacterized repeat protein (TIGR03847 family)
LLALSRASFPKLPGTQTPQTRRYELRIKIVPENIDFDPVDQIGVGTVGPPGQRQFFLRASGGGREVVLQCEKVHVQGLVLRFQQILSAQGKEVDLPAGTSEPASPGQAEWAIGELGLGFHESKARFVLVAREAPASEEPVQQLATARFWMGEDQVQRFLAQAAVVLAGGRPACPLCGLPVDPRGHPCPASNGSRPVF